MVSSVEGFHGSEQLEVCSLCSRKLLLNPRLCPNFLVLCYLEVAVIQGNPAGESGQMDQVYMGEQILSHSSGQIWDQKNFEPLSALQFLSQGLPYWYVSPGLLGMQTDPRIATVPSTQEEKCLPSVPCARPGGEGRSGEFLKLPVREEAGTFASRLDLALGCSAASALAHSLVLQVTMVRGVYNTGKRPGRVQVDAQRQSGTWGYMEPGGATFWLENLPLATGPFGASFRLSIKSSPLTSFREE